jgi:hypothetical protein
MLIRIVLVAVVVLGVMLAVKSGYILRGAGLLSECEVVTSTNGAWGELRSCDKGKLNGWQDLSDTCSPLGRHGPKEYWRCPYSPVAADA